MIRPLLFGVLLWAVAVYAFRRGGKDEKIVAASFIIATYISPLLVISLTRFQKIELPLATVDIGVGCVLLFVALRSQKFWPLWLTAMEGLTIFSHFALLVPHMIPWNYRNAVVLWSWPMLIVLAAAIRRHHQERTIYTRA